MSNRQGDGMRSNMNRQGDPPFLILVQAIQVRWTKASRGAPGATMRNRVPEGFALPSSQPSAPPTTPSEALVPPWHHPHDLISPDAVTDHTADLFLDRVTYGESNQFLAPLRREWTALATRLPEKSTLLTTPRLIFAGRSEGVQVEFSWHEAQGKPRRHHLHLSERVTLTPGQWMRARYNARHEDSDGLWFYTKQVINVGIAHRLLHGFFLNSTPDFQLSDMAELF